VFLPYLASCCNYPCEYVREDVVDIIQELSSCLPTLHKRELGEMLLRVYCNVEDPDVRRGLVVALYDIGQKVPDFMTDFPDVFSEACTDPDDFVSEIAEVRKAMTMLTSLAGVDAINEVFWDQSLGVKKELLRQIRRESMINWETAEVAMKMALNYLEGSKCDSVGVSISVLLSVPRFFL